MTIGEKITEWYLENGRDLPWRNSQDAYKVWISEVILQQTRIAQGIDYFYRFIEKFPDIQTLSNAEIDEVLKYWEGLGYYSRARNLHAAAKELTTKYEGKFPTHHSEIIKLKGIGPYTARAIGSFAFGNQTGVIDGNVLRVMSRVLNDFSPIDDTKTRNKFQEIIDVWVEKTDSAPFNHGIMDIGATICTPTKPACMICPLEAECIARKEGSMHLLPVKGKKLVRPTRYYHFYLIYNEQQEFAILRRPEKGLWGGLYEIPNEEVEKEVWMAKKSNVEGTYLGGFKHVFTHFDMELQVFALVSEDTDKGRSDDIFFIPVKKIADYAFSKAVLKIFEQYVLH